jgi:hypothetical protein
LVAAPERLAGCVSMPPVVCDHDPDDRRNQCYGHGDRQEPPRPPLSHHTARAAFINYASVLEAARLRC